MAMQEQIGTSDSKGRNKAKVTLGVVLFLLGVVAGVVGLCAALKVIFYIGLAVAIIAAVALVCGIIAVKNQIEDDD